jgi:putative deaminase of polymorphic toxin system
MKVQVCYGEGDDKQCNTYSDKQFADAKKSLQDSGFTVKDGKIINDEGNQVGTFTRLSDDSLSPLANGLLYGPQSLGARADGMKGLIGLHAAAGVIGGTGVGVGLTVAGGGAGVTTLGNGIGTVARLRTIFDIGAKRTIAYATYEIEGASGSLVSASGQAARQGLSNAANTLFGTLREGVRSRAFDAEVKILEQIGNGLTTNPTARGVINMFVERPPCPSCVGVINQFRATFPSIEVIVKTIPFRF